MAFAVSFIVLIAGFVIPENRIMTTIKAIKRMIKTTTASVEREKPFLDFIYIPVAQLIEQPTAIASVPRYFGSALASLLLKLQ